MAVAAVLAFAPLIAMLPELIIDMQEMVAIMRSPDLSPEERESRLNALADRMDRRVVEIADMQLPARRTD
ncbi:MAG TPA: hypothetical protein VJ816_08255 [Gemmatimonadales bacterium]|nr:hypothetical protein [Gemmatimonadales bacterium]